MDIQKWSKFSLAQQLGHIGSEISRARHWEEKKDLTSRDNALERALELVDLTLEDRRWRLRLKEIVRLREVIGDWLIGQKNYDVLPSALEEYCTSFTLVTS